MSSHGAPGLWYQGTPGQQSQSLCSTALDGGWSAQSTGGTAVGPRCVQAGLGMGVWARPGIWQGPGHAGGVSSDLDTSLHPGEHKVSVALGLGPCMSRQGHARNRDSPCTSLDLPQPKVLEPESSPPGSWHSFLLSWGGQFCPKVVPTRVWLFLATLFSTGSKTTCHSSES